MCYPKPGPRCSAHAATRLTKAKVEVKVYRRQISDALSNDKYYELKKAVEEAQLDYDATPAGMEELKRRAAYYSDSQKEEYQLRLELGQQLRASQLSAIKALEQGDIKHDSVPLSGVYSKNSHDTSKIIRKSYPNDAPEIALMMEESQNWINELTPEETEAVAWFTSNGAGSVNNYLVGKKDDFNYSPVLLKTTAEKMDSALKKWVRPKPVLVYRGLSQSVVGEKTYNKTEDAALAKLFLDENFPVGGIYTSPTFMSASLDPERASRFASSDFVLEIVSKKAAPVVNISAWDISEREMVLPRKQKYEVMRVLKNIKFETSSGDVRERTVIQLIEID